MANNIGLFFNTSKNTRSFAEVLAQVQEYLASKYSTLITDNPEEQRQQITAYIAKYLNDYSLGVEGMDHEALIDKLYTEMAEFSLYYRVVVIRAPLQGLCYTVRDAVDWLGSPTTRWFQKGSNHSPLQFC